MTQDVCQLSPSRPRGRVTINNSGGIINGNEDFAGSVAAFALLIITAHFPRIQNRTQILPNILLTRHGDCAETGLG